MTTNEIHLAKTALALSCANRKSAYAVSQLIYGLSDNIIIPVIVFDGTEI